MMRPITLIIITVCWIVMMSLLIRREYFQLTPVKAAYEVFSIGGLEQRREYRGIYLGSELIGFNWIALEKSEEKPEEGFRLAHQTYMSFLFLGHEREMLVKGTARLDARLELKEFKVRITSGEYWTEISGQIAGDDLNLAVEGKGSLTSRKVLKVRHPLFFSEALALIWTPENLKPGKRGHLDVWNPLLMGTESVEFRVGQKELLAFDGQQAEAYRIDLQQEGVETGLWCSPEGVLLKQESPTGLTFIKQDAWKIFDRLRETRSALADVPNLYSISSNQALESPEKLKELSVRVKSPEGEKTLRLRRKNPEVYRAVMRPLENPPEDMIPYLASTEYVQSDNPDIEAQAWKIAGSESSALTAAEKIMRWVRKRISPTPTVGVPSAAQVFHVRKGDCNEYTVLFTALSRSLGIPTKMVSGLIYRAGRFFYHAWPEIYLGEWIGLDPTLDQLPNDVTHIPLSEGGLNEQIEIIRKLGKLNVFILEAK